MKKIFLIFVCLSFSILAQSAGLSGLSFLKNGFGARNIAMSDLGVISSNDLSALNYNPSLLVIIDKSQISFSHNSLYQDLTSEMLGASFSVFGLPWAVGINTTNISNIEVRTRPGDIEGTFSAHYFDGSISTAIKIYDQVYAGVTFKYLYENVYSDEANGYGVDFGVAYKDIIYGLSAGASIKNLGSMNALRNVSTELPNDLRIGVNYEIYFNHLTLNTTAGFQKYLKEDDSHLHVGAEIIYNQLFALRLGYASGYDAKGLSTGFGIVWNNLNMDYAYVPTKYGLGDSHIITLTYSFN